MNCPACKGPNLIMAERSGIEIDYCPQCRGVWLDRGELDKIIERVTPASATPDKRNLERSSHAYEDDDDYDRRRKRKKRGLLGELFDF
jgi:Zn-finger nucleic acid-binding protein